MIRHIVFFTVSDEHKLEDAVSHLERLGTIPSVNNFAVRRNLKMDQIENLIDLVVYGEFEDRDALSAYKRHPTYADVTSIVRPMRDQRFAADIEG